MLATRTQMLATQAHTQIPTATQYANLPLQIETNLCQITVTTDQQHLT